MNDMINNMKDIKEQLFDITQKTTNFFNKNVLSYMLANDTYYGLWSRFKALNVDVSGCLGALEHEIYKKKLARKKGDKRD